MKKKRIASKLLSLLLSAAVIVSSSFSGITLIDVSATQAAETEAVAVSDNSADVTVEETQSVSENDADVAEEETVEEETTEEYEKPVAEKMPAVEDSSEKVKSVSTKAQPYVSDHENVVQADAEERDVAADSVFELVGDNDFAAVSFGGAEPAYVYGEGTTDGEVAEVSEVSQERATTTPRDDELVGKLMGEKALANAILEIYNKSYNAGDDLVLSEFTFA